MKKTLFFIGGALFGAAVALLAAPNSGKETRAVLAKKADEAWGEAQQLSNQVGEGVQTTYQQVVEQAGQKWQEVSARGQELYDQAQVRIQEVSGSVPSSFTDKTDDLKEKIDAARQRIAAQVAQNAKETAENVEAEVEVAAEEPAEEPVEEAVAEEAPAEEK